MIESLAEWAWMEIARATLLLVAVAGAAFTLRRASAATRHLVWCAGLCALLSLPLLAAAVPWRWSPWPAQSAASPVLSPIDRAPVDATAPEVREPARDRGAAAATVPTARPESMGVRARAFLQARGIVLLGLVWATGVAVSLMRLAMGAIVLRVAVRGGRILNDPSWRTPLYEAADRLGLDRVPRLVQSGRMPMPYVTGLVRPMIVLPVAASSWTTERRRAVLLHELAHVRRRDLVLDAMGRVACAIWWFHPLARIAARRLRAESERACDDLVLRVGTRPSTYADHLLQIVRDAGRASVPASALPMAQRHEFEGRMLAILEADARRDPPRRRHAVLALAAFALLLVPLAGAGPAAASGNPTTALPPVLPLEPRQDAVEARADVEAGAEAGRDAGARADDDAGAGADVDAAARMDADPEAAPAEDDGVSEAERTPPPAAATLSPTPSATQQDTGVVGALRGALRDESAMVRREAVRGLGRLEAASAVPDMVALLDREPDAQTRELIVWSLAQVGDASAVDALARAVRGDADPEVREMATWGLGQFRQEAGLPAIIDALRDENERVRGIAAWALGTLRPATAPAELIAAFDDEDGEVREHAAWAAGHIRDPAAIDGLARLVADEAAGKVALWAIGQIGGEAARPALMEALRSGSPEVRAAAARALAGRGSNPWPWPWPRPMH